MTGRDLWDGLYSQVSEVFRLMMTQAVVEVKHPRHAGTVGTVEAVILRPGKNNIYEIAVSAEVKEMGRNSIHVTLPDYIRKVGSDGRKTGMDPLALATVPGTGTAGGDHSGMLRFTAQPGVGGAEAGGKDPGRGDGGQLQEAAGLYGMADIG
ncbi:MAG: hypothetical protein IJ043_03305 [Clostridia bacterium]|nr:hypothetical protein [Clostridia bacterium]